MRYVREFEKIVFFENKQTNKQQQQQQQQKQQQQQQQQQTRNSRHTWSHGYSQMASNLVYF